MTRRSAAGRAAGSPPSGGPDAGAMPTSPRSTGRFLTALFIAVLGLQLLLYRQSFGVKPSNDDFVALHQVDRGDMEGPSSFFHASNFDDYRPLMNATVWLFGRISRRHLLLSLRILHVLSFVFYASIAFLWMRSLRLGRVAAIASACVVFLHPTQAGALAGLDNFARFVVNAWVWLGAWIASRWAGRPLLAVPLVALCFAIGLGYMEYAIALIPLATLFTVWPRSKHRVRNGSIMLVALATVFIVYFLIRVSGRAATTSGAGFLSLDPLLWVKNAAMILVAELFFGNTVPVMIDRSPANLAWLASNVTAVAAALGYGLWAARHEALPDPGGAPAGSPRTDGGPGPALGLLCAAWAASFFPMVLMRHISEIYISSVTLGLALLAGLAARGWTTASRPLRVVLMLFAGFQLMLAAQAIQSKIAGLNDGGERAEALIQRVLERIPDDGSARRIAMVFLKRDAGAAGGSYSVFAIPDDQLILPGTGAFAIRWYRRDLDVRLDQFLVTEPSEVDGRSYDAVLLWNPSTGQFRPLSPSEGRL